MEGPLKLRFKGNHTNQAVTPTLGLKFHGKVQIDSDTRTSNQNVNVMLKSYITRNTRTTIWRIFKHWNVKHVDNEHGLTFETIILKDIVNSNVKGQ